ncbi:hypothetical protein GHT06_001830 [Daphnia sinensis]|uniref:Uncharacterized protein n=1 Tax=Daphnia sinensis TaxID=1820382 RepID=A0AAD5KSL9_9CRUS|nr:hypothetical protein GHT06_001830 [Daphnia sinensis]
MNDANSESFSKDALIHLLRQNKINIGPAQLDGIITKDPLKSVISSIDPDGNVIFNNGETPDDSMGMDDFGMDNMGMDDMNSQDQMGMDQNFDPNAQMGQDQMGMDDMNSQDQMGMDQNFDPNAQTRQQMAKRAMN